MTKKKSDSNGSNGHSRTVSVDQDEYKALCNLRDEHHALLTAEHAKLVISNQELTETVKQQVTRLGLLDTRCSALEQLVLLRREIVATAGGELRVEMRIPMSRVPARPSLDAIIKQVMKTPDVTDVALFDYFGRRLHPQYNIGDAAARAAFDEAGPKKQQMLQGHLIHQLQLDNAKLIAENERATKELEKLKADIAAGKPIDAPTTEAKQEVKP